MKIFIPFSRITQLYIQQTLPVILLLTAIVGLFASFTLTVEHINLLKDPSHSLSCSINPVLACGPIMHSKEATVFGFPNPLIGLVMFGAQLMMAVAMLAGAHMKRWFWRLYGLGILVGLVFTGWLVWHSLYVIGAICIYCFMVWIILPIAAWYIFQYMLAEKYISLKSSKFLRKHHGDILAIFFIFLVILILNRFWYFYGPKLGF